MPPTTSPIRSCHTFKIPTQHTPYPHASHSVSLGHALFTLTHRLAPHSMSSSGTLNTHIPHTLYAHTLYTLMPYALYLPRKHSIPSRKNIHTLAPHIPYPYATHFMPTRLTLYNLTPKTLNILVTLYTLTPYTLYLPRTSANARAL